MATLNKQTDLESKIDYLIADIDTLRDMVIKTNKNNAALREIADKLERFVPCPRSEFLRRWPAYNKTMGDIGCEPDMKNMGMRIERLLEFISEQRFEDQIHLYAKASCDLAALALSMSTATIDVVSTRVAALEDRIEALETGKRRDEITTGLEDVMKKFGFKRVGDLSDKNSMVFEPENVAFSENKEQ